MGKKIDCMEPFDFNFQGMDCKLEFDLSRCYENGSSMIVIRKRKDESRSFPFATISQYVPEFELEEDEFILNTWEMYSELINYLMEEMDYFEETKRTVDTEYGVSPVWKIK